MVLNQTDEERIAQIIDRVFSKTVCMDDIEHNLEVSVEILTEAKQALIEIVREARREANIRQIENWRDWIKPNPDLKWLVEEMDNAIVTLKDRKLTDENGVYRVIIDTVANTPAYLETTTDQSTNNNTEEVHA